MQAHLAKIQQLENEFIEVANKVAQMNAAEAEKSAKQKTTTEDGSGVKYSYYSGSKTSENIFDTPQNFLPDLEQEWSTFNRQFANKTNSLKKNQKRNIIIYTVNYAYFVSASGYMRGKIVAKIEIDGNEERINSISKEFKDGTFEIGEGTNLLAQSIRGDRGRGYRHHASLKETLAAEGDEGLDGKEYSGDRGRNNRESNKTAKNAKLSLSDSDSAYLEAVEKGDMETAQRPKNPQNKKPPPRKVAKKQIELTLKVNRRIVFMMNMQPI